MNADRARRVIRRVDEALVEEFTDAEREELRDLLMTYQRATMFIETAGKIGSFVKTVAVWIVALAAVFALVNWGAPK